MIELKGLLHYNAVNEAITDKKSQGAATTLALKKWLLCLSLASISLSLKVFAPGYPARGASVCL